MIGQLGRRWTDKILTDMAQGDVILGEASYVVVEIDAVHKG